MVSNSLYVSRTHVGKRRLILFLSLSLSFSAFTFILIVAALRIASMNSFQFFSIQRKTLSESFAGRERAIDYVFFGLWPKMKKELWR